MNGERDNRIDFFRGLVIADMVLVHVSGYFPQGISFLIESFDFAVEGFIFLAGFMIGRHYLARFQKDALAVIKRLIGRAGKLVVIQYIMILTISLPYYSFFILKSRDDIIAFATASFLFLNQIPILHILPTFIPLFVASPVLLILLARDYDYLLLIASLTLFLIGCYTPYLFSIVDKTIFPVILWQIYYVIGCILGKKSNEAISVNYNKIFILAVALLGFCLLLKYGSYFEPIRNIKTHYTLYPKKFPLNVYGLLYGSSLLLFLYALTMKFWSLIKTRIKVVGVITLLGRQSLPLFVIHAYFVYLIRAVTQIGAEKIIVYPLMLISAVGTYTALLILDRWSKENRLPFAYRWLFT
jgi:hypothetical protein